MVGCWAELSSLVLPVPCAGCGRGRSLLCEGCRAALAPGASAVVRPWAAPSGLPPVRAAAWYAGPVRAVLLAHKERGALPLAAPLGGLLASAARAACVARRPPAAPGGAVWLVPVPSGRRTVARRGHDPLRRMARVAAGRMRAWGYGARVYPALGHARPVVDQTGLDAAARRANLAGALRARPPSGGWGGPVVLVDDLMTTGASLAEAARALRRADPPGVLVGAAVVAVPPAGERTGRHDT